MDNELLNVIVYDDFITSEDYYKAWKIEFPRIEMGD